MTRNSHKKPYEATPQKKLMDSGAVLTTVEEELYSTYSDLTHGPLKAMLTVSSHNSRFSIRQSLEVKQVAVSPRGL
jgi:hypothetical protein